MATTADTLPGIRQEAAPPRPPADASAGFVARCRALIHAHWRRNRTAVNPDTDPLIADLHERLGGVVREFAAGQETLTWIVPRRWCVRAGRLSRLDGTPIVDYADHPLHLWTHSVPFEGVVSREELEAHLHHDPQRPDVIPYHFVHGYRYAARPTEWGFCLTHRQYQALTDAEYRVHIDADLDLEGAMKVLDVHLPGSSPVTWLFAAHTCHPGQATDGLTNVAVLAELFAGLAARTERRCGYRLIIGPEYFAAAAFLATTPVRDLSHVRGAVYVDMLGNRQTFGGSHSFQGDTPIDRALFNVLRQREPGALELAHRKLAGNDELFYNGPGFEIPTVEFGCGPHPEHHSSADNPTLVDYGQLQRGHDLLRELVDVFETDFVPVRRFRGPLYLSRYGLYTPLQADEHAHDVQEGVQILMDGRRSCLDIAHELRADFAAVRDFCLQLERRGLVTRLSTPAAAAPAAGS